ncbi:VOC family protein, partial [Candidatus Saccharibacteria bacterium]|nr:VOC family protein [Candidatus Saccharibacteria bacterium]
MKIKHVDHVGITVNDMQAVKGFFLELGFTNMGETTVEGEWVGRIIGLKDVKSDIVMLSAPDGQVNIELSRFHHPKAVGDTKYVAVNTLGLRHISFIVEDLDGILDSLKSKGTKLVGDVHNYEDVWKVCYIH